MHFNNSLREEKENVISIKDIAKYAETSVASVSRVLNQSGYVSANLRARIEAAIETLNYQPSIAAQGLRSKQTRAIGVMFPALDVPFFSILAHAIERTLFEHNYYALICNTDNSIQRETGYVNMLLSHRVGGVIITSFSDKTEHLQKIVRKNIPIVALDLDLPLTASACVRSDHYEGGRLMAKHVIELGHRKLAILGASGFIESVQLRVRAIIDESKQSAVAMPVPQSVLWNEHSMKAAYAAAFELLSQSDRPTALLCLSDLTAVGVLHAAHDLGIKVPRDLSVVGFDNLPAAEHAIPSLTSIAQPISMLGAQSVYHVLDKMGVKPPHDLQGVLPVELIVRGSTGPAPI